MATIDKSIFTRLPTVFAILPVCTVVCYVTKELMHNVSVYIWFGKTVIHSAKPGIIIIYS